MALTRTLIGSSAAISDQTAGTGHDGTFDCGTVAAGDLVCVVCGGTDGNTTSSPVWTTPSKSSGTATISAVTEIANSRIATNATATERAWWFTVTAGGTLVLAYGDDLISYGPGICVWKYTGHDTGTPIAGAITDAEAATTLTPATATLGATPTVDDDVIGVIDWDTNAGAGKGVTPGSGFTELALVGTATDFVMMQVAFRTGSTSTSVPWATQDGTPTVFSTSGLAFIVKALAGPGVAVPGLSMRGRGRI